MARAATTICRRHRPPRRCPCEKPARKRKHEIVERAREKHPRVYERWTGGEDQQLTLLFAEGKPVKEIARTLERQRGAITSRLLKLGLIAQAEGDETAADRMASGAGGAVQPQVSPAAESVTTGASGWEAFRDRLNDNRG